LTKWIKRVQILQVFFPGKNEISIFKSDINPSIHETEFHSSIKC
jgi:hypothetical protein